MDLMYTKIKQEHINVYWQPFATSTPLKIVQSNLKVNDRKKQVHKSTDSLNVLLKKCYNTSSNPQNKEASESKSKNSVKSRKPSHFDVSSSDEDDDSKENNKRPVIKINSANVVKRKSLIEIEKCEKEEDELSKVTGIGEKSFKSKDKSPARRKAVRSKSGHAEVKHVKKRGRTICPSSLKSNCEIKVAEENQVKVGDKENELNLLTNGNAANLENSSDKMPAVNAIEKVNDSINCIVRAPSVTVGECKQSNSSPHGSIKMGQLKRKGSKVLLVTPAKKTRRKKNKESEKILEFGDSKTVLDKVLPHQLFSDSAEQELINTLDLTAVEVNEEPLKLNTTVQKSKPSPTKKQKEKVVIKKEVKQERPTRRRQAPKEFWMPDSQSDESNGVKAPPPKENISKPNRKEKKEKAEKKEVEQKENAAQPEVFRQLNEVTYSGTQQSGCFTSECWSVKNFKCGVFKVNSKSCLSNRTMHSNSCFGGVLIKGSLRMKVGSREFDLKEGDMIFVPPLTDWEARNTSGSESIVYYWSGRFKT